jgi:peptidyl-prolyl cis-trans isomerase A (cyclophilin A)
LNRQLLSRRSLLVSAIAFASVSSARDKADPSTEQVAIVTSLGTISVAVDVLRAPMSAGNFLEYVDRHLFDEAQFYRSVHAENDANPVKISVLQGGMPDRTKGLGPIPHESTRQTGLRHLDGTISIARRELGTGSAVAFFICIGDQPELDFGGRRNPDGQGFAAFGRVHKGMDIVRAMWMQPTVGTDGSIGAQTIASPIRIETAIRNSQRLLHSR